MTQTNGGVGDGVVTIVKYRNHPTTSSHRVKYGVVCASIPVGSESSLVVFFGRCDIVLRSPVVD